MWIAYHDVRWNGLDQVDRDLQILSQLGILTVALGIIPDVPKDQQESYRRWIENRKAQGYELLTHGWKHECDTRIPCSMWGRFQRWITHNEAEFAGLSPVDAHQTLDNAVIAGQSLGLERLAFVPPTWHASSSLKDICLQSGFTIYESRFYFHIHGKRYWNFPISIAGLPRWMPKCILWITRHMPKHFSDSVRYVLHPGELEKYPLWLDLLSTQKSYQRYSDLGHL